MLHEPCDLPADFDGKVRLFPLPELVLFPSNLQPLHIFEERYREMFEEALHGDRLITMATLEPGFEAEYDGRPAISPIVCIGHIATHERNDNGTHNLVLLGLRRACIERELPLERSFRQAVVQVVEDEHPDSASETSHLGGDLAKRLGQLVPSAQRLVDAFREGDLTLGTLTDIVAFHLVDDVACKLELLANANVVERARLLLARLSQVTRPEYPPRFSLN